MEMNFKHMTLDWCLASCGCVKTGNSAPRDTLRGRIRSLTVSTAGDVRRKPSSGPVCPVRSTGRRGWSASGVGPARSSVRSASVRRSVCLLPYNSPAYLADPSPGENRRHAGEGHEGETSGAVGQHVCFGPPDARGRGSGCLGEAVGVFRYGRLVRPDGDPVPGKWTGFVLPFEESGYRYK